MSAYGVFAAYYDRLTGDAGYGARAEYIASLLRENRVPDGGAVLDLACGTGSPTLLLASMGYDMTGVDGSPEMLAEARVKADREGVKLLLLCQELTRLDLYGTYDAAVCTLDSVNHLLSEREVGRFFSRLSLFLEDSGIFIFDVNTPYKHREILGDNCFVLEEDGLYCVWRNRYDEALCTVDIELDFFEERAGVYVRSGESFSERAYDTDTLKGLLADAGFRTLAVYEELTRDAPRRDTQRAVFVAERRARHGG